MDLGKLQRHKQGESRTAYRPYLTNLPRMHTYRTGASAIGNVNLTRVPEAMRGLRSASNILLATPDDIRFSLPPLCLSDSYNVISTLLQSLQTRWRYCTADYAVPAGLVRLTHAKGSRSLISCSDAGAGLLLSCPQFVSLSVQPTSALLVGCIMCGLAGLPSIPTLSQSTQ